MIPIIVLLLIKIGVEFLGTKCRELVGRVTDKDLGRF